MTEQINYGMAALLQATAAQQIPTVQTGKSESGEPSDFQKLLDRAQNPQDVEQPQSTQTSQTASEKKDSPKAETEDRKQAPAQDAEEAKKTEVTVDQQSQWGQVFDNRVYVGHFVDDGTTQEAVAFAYNQETGEWYKTTIEIKGHLAPGEGVKGWLEGPGIQPRMMAAAVQPMVQRQAIPVEETVETAVVQSQPEEVIEVSTQPEMNLEQDVQPKTEISETSAPVVQETAEEGEKVEVTDVSVGAKPVFHDVEAAPIKVGEAPAAEQGDTPDVGRQLSAPLVNALEQGDSRVTVQLNPENLGSVEIEITQSANGVLHVALTAANSETRGLLEKHAANLQAMLGSRGQEVVQVEVQRQEESQQGQNHSYDGHNGNPNQQQQQEQRRQRQSQNGGDFLQQLRLGLIPLDADMS